MGRDMDIEHTFFIRNVPFVKNWPVHKLTESPSAWGVHSFSPGQVVVRDSLESDWIYIVKSGSLSVMKKLQERKTRSTPGSQRELRAAKVYADVALTYKERCRRRKICLPLKLPPIPKREFHSHIEMQIKMNDNLPGVYKESDRLGILDYDRIVQDYKSRLRVTKVSETMAPGRQGNRQTTTDNNRLRPDDVIESESGNSSTIDEQEDSLPVVRKNTRGVYMAASRPRRRPQRKDRQKPDQGEDVRNDQYTSELQSDHKAARPTPVDLESMGAPPTEASGTVAPLTTLTPNDKAKTTFILVQVLKRGQYFGVGNLVFREVQPSLSLVSNGVECILLSKSFFKQHASEHVINSLRKTEVPYPSEGELQRKLADHNNWATYRARNYRRLVQPVVERKARKRQYTTNYLGQYNYRTGPL